MIFNGRKIKDITGMRSGRLVAIRPVNPENRYGDINRKVTLWECKCDCGCMTIQRTSRIARGERKSCGCVNDHSNRKKPNRPRSDRAILMEKRGNIPLWYFHRLEDGARKRGIRFDVSIEYINQLFDRQEGKCCLSGRQLVFEFGYGATKKTTASLDRINSSLGYVEGNLQWIYKMLNKMKGNWSDERFIQECVKTWEIIRDVALTRGCF